MPFTTEDKPLDHFRIPAPPLLHKERYDGIVAGIILVAAILGGCFVAAWLFTVIW